ncbi:MAG: MlaD family protein [Myxococcota bacterium]
MASSFRNQVGCGLVIVTGAVLLAVMALMASNFDLRPTTTVSVLMEDAVGVGAKADVMVAGVRVGRVADVSVEHDKARVTLEIYDSAGVRKDVGVRMRAKSVLGEKYLELLPRSVDAALLQDGDELAPGAPNTEIDEMVNALGPLVEALDPATVHRALASVNEALDEDPERLARMLRNADEALENAAAASRELKPAVAEGRVTLARANRALGELESRARQAEALITHADAVLGDLEQASEPLPELVAKAGSALDDVREVVSPMATATEDLSTILANFRDVDEETLRRLLREDGVRVHLFGDGRKKHEEER